MAATGTSVHVLASGLAAVAARLRQSTVQVRTAEQAGGAGVIWRTDGLIVTSAHVVTSTHGVCGGALVVLVDGRQLPGALVAWDRQLDLALIRVAPGSLPAVVVGDSDGLRPGELVLAVGHPFGLVGAVTTGIVHAAPGRWGRGRLGWIQADLRLAPGNSGGPLADARGQVVGVTAMIARGLALAVPSHAVQAFVTRAAGA